MERTKKTGKQREDRSRTIRMGNEDWERLDAIAKQRGLTRHGFVVKTIKKALVDATPRTNKSEEILR
jgi:predicted DNA-binding protein